MSGEVIPGPGTVRVGRFIGRLGVVSIPAVAVGLDLDQRVVRRHVAKLESAGWLARAPWVWGEGSVVWLTSLGVESVGLGGLRPVKSPPARTTIAHGVLVGWSAARLERRGLTWQSARELALDNERWAVMMRCERGYTKQLPDLAGWLQPDAPPVALIIESGGRREDRQKLILAGWRDAVASGRYARVQYDCTDASVVHWISRLAKKVRFTAPDFKITEQPRAAAEIAALSLVNADDAPDTATVPPRSSEHVAPADERPVTAPGPAPAMPAEWRPQIVAAAQRPQPEPPEAAAERERILREVLGYAEPRPRRRWRR